MYVNNYLHGGIIMFDRKEYNKNYKKEKLKRIPLDVTQDHYNDIKSHTEKTHETVNGFIKRAINETIERDASDPGTTN